MKPKLKLRLIAEEINSSVFNNALDISVIDFHFKKKDENARAWYYRFNKTPFIQIIKKHHENDNELIASIAHELIHYYQDCLDIPINHGGKFFRYYKEKICRIYQIENPQSF